MKIEIHNTLVEKAKTKKDGVYEYQGFVYAVKNNNFIAYADYHGDLSTVHGVFHYRNGKCERYDRKKVLKEYIKNS